MQSEPTVSSQPNPNQSVRLPVNPWVISGLLLVALVVVLAWWHPWSRPATSDRTITVSGQATITAEPDEYVFNPSYEFKNTDKAAALSAVTAKSDAVTAGLKALGVTDKQIKSNANGYNYGGYYYDESDKDYTYTLSFTITLTDAAQTQKVQDYLVTTAPSGAVTPYAQFSTAKRKTLEAQARDQATKEARSKADQSAKNLGFRVGAVKSVSDSGFGGGVTPMYAEDTVNGSVSSGTQLKVQAGENDLDYSVTVVYYVR